MHRQLCGCHIAISPAQPASRHISHQEGTYTEGGACIEIGHKLSFAQIPSGSIPTHTGNHASCSVTPFSLMRSNWHM